METDQDTGEQLHQTLEAHEREVKRAFESLGQLQEDIEQAADAVEEETVIEEFAEFGRTVAQHERQLQTVLETLDEHKRVIRSVDSIDRTALQEAMEQARAQARQENHPPDPNYDDAHTDRE